MPLIMIAMVIVSGNLFKDQLFCNGLNNKFRLYCDRISNTITISEIKIYKLSTERYDCNITKIVKCML